MTLKRVLIACGILIAVVIAAAGIFIATFDVNQLRPKIQAELERQLHRSVALGDMSLSLFPLGVRVANVQIGENPAFPTGRPFATIHEVRVRAELLPLLQKDIRIDSLDFDQPTIELVNNPSGVWNMSDLTSQQSSGGKSGSMQLSSLQITDGALSLASLMKPASRTVYQHINATLTDFAPGKVFHVKASAQLPGAKADSFVLDGSGGPLNGSDTPFNGHVSISGAPASALARFTGTNLPVDGVATGAADISSSGTTTGLRGNLSIDRASVHGSQLGIPLAVDFDVTSDSRSGLVDARRANIKAGSVLLSSGAQINTRQDTIHAVARTSNANVTELLKLARALGAGNISGSGIVSLDATVSGPTNGPWSYSGSGSIPQAKISTGSGSPTEIRNAALRFDGNSAAITAGALSAGGIALTGVRTSATLNRGILTLSPVTAQVFGGTASGTVAIDTNPNPNAVTANVKLASVEANQLLSATTSLKNTLYGPLTASTNMRVRLYPASEAEARSMNGQLALNLTNGRLAGINAMNELSNIAKFAGYRFSPQSFTTIRKLSGNLTIVNGVASTKDLQLQMDGGSLAATGSMDLAAQTLNLKTTAVLDRGTSQNVGGKSIGGFMQTALANGNGELVIPAIVTGSFAHPRFAPDVQQMAQMKVKSLLPTTGSPGKAISNILGGSNQQQQGTSQQQLQNTVGNALNSIFNKKKKQQ